MLSGKFVLRLDPETHQSLKEEAKAHGESLNSLCLRKLKGGANTAVGSEITDRIVQEFAPEGLVLFGSVARGEASARSDVDLLIVLPQEVPISRKLYQQWDEVFRHVGDKYSPQFVHLPKTQEVIGSIWLETALDGEILYDEKKLVKSVLIKIRSQIAEGRYLRKVSHGHSYWIRQEPHAE